jgi:hypothetical protein
MLTPKAGQTGVVAGQHGIVADGVIKTGGPQHVIGAEDGQA